MEIEKIYTLRQLFNAGKKTQDPVRARMVHWGPTQWFEIVGICKHGLFQAYGFTDNGMGLGYDPEERVWVRVKVKKEKNIELFEPRGTLK